MARVFISYSRKDEPFVRRIATDLDGYGVSVWLDVDEIPAGMKWSAAIQEGLITCDAMIIVISPDSMASRNVEDEWQYYLDRAKPLIPVRRAPADIHFQLNRLQYIDFHEQEYDIALGLLRAELERHGLTLQALLDEAGTPVSAEAADTELAGAPDTGGIPTRYLAAGVAIIVLLMAAAFLVFGVLLGGI
jgi:hypothetical protein